MAMLFWLLAQAIAIILLAFSLRRAVLLIAACLPKPPNHPVIQSPNLLILIPCRDEALSLPALFAALDQLDYPRDKLQAVLVDDGSDDQTVRLAEAWAVARLWAHALPLAKNLGKAQALNQALTPS
ncbi:MAG: glycosyltransferase, partial [Anaerolineales bacterium]